jgi:shikimate kinase
MKNIVLIGMMGSGKTTCGQLLAQRLNRELVDTDVLIVAREGRAISDIFAAEGENYFRELERTVSEELAQREDLVVACGGGLPLRPDCIGPLKNSGTVIFLNRDAGEIYDSVSMDGRPLAQDGRESFLERFRQREPIYRRWADLEITDFSSTEATLESILRVLG